MPTSYVKDLKIQVRQPDGAWSEPEPVVCGFEYEPPKEAETGYMSAFKDIKLDIQWQEGGLDDWRAAFGLRRLPPSTDIRYVTGNRWFHPTVVMKDATVYNLGERKSEGSIFVDIDFLADKRDVEWPNVWARPVYYLWRMWTKVREWVRGWIERQEHVRK